MKAGYCSECAAYVWLSDEGACLNGHPASAVSNVYEAQISPPPAARSIRREVPGWASAAWGLVLVLLNLFMVVYVVGFTLAFASFPAGPSGPSWLAGPLSSEQAFMSLFGVVSVAVALSFALMALSLLHIFRWSGLPMDRKLLWAAIVYAGAQPGMLAYWFMNVRRREQEPRRRAAGASTSLNRLWVAALGVLTVLPALYFIFFFVAVAGLAVSGSGEPVWLDYLPAMHIGMILLWWALTAVYLVDVFRTPRLEGNTRAIWAALVAFGGPIAWPVYWYMNMWRGIEDPA